MKEKINKLLDRNLELILTLIAIAVGIIFILAGIGIMLKDNKTVNIFDVNKNELKDGIYVKGHIGSLVKSSEETKEDRCLITNVDTEDGSFDVYNMPFGDTYITLMLNEFDNPYTDYIEPKSYDESMYIYGVIREVDTTYLNFRDWEIDREMYPNYDNRIQGYAIIQMEEYNSSPYILRGAVLIIVSLLIYIVYKEYFCDTYKYKKRKEYVVDKTLIKEDKETITKKVLAYRRSNNLEAELELERLHFNNLCKRRDENRKIIPLLFLLYGIQYLILWGIIVNIMFLPVLFYIIQICLGLVIIKFLWIWFINSDTPTAVKLAKKFDLKTDYFEMIICLKDIDKMEAVLLERIEKEEIEGK